ncbi:hypothetical protein BANRA_05460 [Klebsiella pneumoniae]|nr:hypothetical protein BANRA_05460 [Klebsiella pneumoniae]
MGCSVSRGVSRSRFTVNSPCMLATALLQIVGGDKLIIPFC